MTEILLEYELEMFSENNKWELNLDRILAGKYQTELLWVYCLTELLRKRNKTMEQQPEERAHVSLEVSTHVHRLSFNHSTGQLSVNRYYILGKF